jgi:hypothetical protein
VVDVELVTDGELLEAEEHDYEVALSIIQSVARHTVSKPRPTTAPMTARAELAWTALRTTAGMIEEVFGDTLTDDW